MEANEIKAAVKNIFSSISNTLLSDLNPNAPLMAGDIISFDKKAATKLEEHMTLVPMQGFLIGDDEQPQMINGVEVAQPGENRMYLALITNSGRIVPFNSLVRSAESTLNGDVMKQMTVKDLLLALNDSSVTVVKTWESGHTSFRNKKGESIESPIKCYELTSEAL